MSPPPAVTNIDDGVDEEQPRHSAPRAHAPRYSTYTYDTGAPTQVQPKFVDPNTGAPIQVQPIQVQPKFDPNTGAPIGSATAAAKSHDIKKVEQKAQTSMILGIVGIFILGIVLGPLAIWFASSAKKAIKQDPEQFKDTKAKCQAKAGLILGIVDTIVWIVFAILIAVVASRGGSDDYYYYYGGY